MVAMLKMKLLHADTQYWDWHCQVLLPVPREILGELLSDTYGLFIPFPQSSQPKLFVVFLYPVQDFSEQNQLH